MPTKFQNLVNEYLNPFVDDHYGEPFTYMPQVNTPNGRGGDDPSRPSFTAVGVLHEASRSADIEFGNRDGHGNGLRAMVNAPGYDLLIDRRKLPAMTQQALQQGDMLQMRGATSQVVSARFDGISRWELRLMKLEMA